MAEMNAIELNNQIGCEIELSNDGSGEYGDMTKAFKNITTAINEVVYSASYLADGGFSSSLVAGAAPTVTFTGDYIIGDPVCEYLNDIRYEIGASRVTKLKLTQGGKVITCPATFTQINFAGGESTAPNAINVTIAFNGKPVVTQV